MKGKEKKQTVKTVKTECKFGDYAIYAAIRDSKFFSILFRNYKAALIMLLLKWFVLAKGIYNYCFCSVFRDRPGINQFGLFISTISCLYLISYKSEHIHFLLTGFGIPYIFISMSWKSSDEILDMLVWDTNSAFLQCYCVLVILSSSINIVKMLLGKTNMTELSSRGTSRIYLGLKWLCKKYKITKFKPCRQFIEGPIECILLIVIAISLCQYDLYAAAFFGFMAFSEISIQFANREATLKKLELIQAGSGTPLST
ncbi:hypothetical protein [Kordia sp.]|uniref:hypothetical protein n=1 Tax=Kordia sp. TaxID=1965332 RepID=UPI003D6BF97E